MTSTVDVGSLWDADSDTTKGFHNDKSPRISVGFGVLWITRIAPSYKIARNENLKLYPGPDTPTVNLRQLMELLLSKDLSKNSELDFISENNFRFLDG